jgi:hypothetical protein
MIPWVKEMLLPTRLIFPSSDFVIGPFPSGRPRVILTIWFTCEAFRFDVRLSLPGFFMNLCSFPYFISQLRNSIKWSWSISSTKRRVVHFSNCRRACLCDFNVFGSNVTSTLCNRVSIASAIVTRSASSSADRVAQSHLRRLQGAALSPLQPLRQPQNFP